MQIGNVNIDDREYFRLLLAQICSLSAEVTVQREFIQLYFSNSDLERSKIHENYVKRYSVVWEDLKNSLYEKYGKLNLEDLLPPKDMP